MIKKYYQNRALLFSSHLDGRSGFAVLSSVLIVGAIAVSLAVSVLFFGVDSSRRSILTEESFRAKAATRACAEIALGEIRSDSSFSGAGNLVLSGADCSYLVIDLGGEQRRLEIIGQVNGTVKKVKGEINQINPSIIISYFSELGDF